MSHQTDGDPIRAETRHQTYGDSGIIQSPAWVTVDDRNGGSLGSGWTEFPRSSTVFRVGETGSKRTLEPTNSGVGALPDMQKHHICYIWQRENGNFPNLERQPANCPLDLQEFSTNNTIRACRDWPCWF